MVKHDRCKHKKPSIVPAKTVNDTTINDLLLLKNNSIKTKLMEIQNKYGSIQTQKRTTHGLCFFWFSH